MSAPSHTRCSKTAAIHTLGCRLNQAETRLIEDQLRLAGYSLVAAEKQADVAIVHTCVVTKEAEAKSRKMIRRLVRDNPGAKVVVIGCYAQTNADAIAAMDGVVMVLGNDAKMDLPRYLAALEDNVTTVVRDRPSRDAFTVPFVVDGPPITRRTNLKIQDGCDAMCSYCYVPFARGRSRSRCFEDTLAEAATLVQRGARELILTGVNIGTYQDNDRGLLQLVDGMNGLCPTPRIRISSIERNTVPEALLMRMADPEHALVPHLHIPLQSGSEDILRAMGRPYAPVEYLTFLQRAAEAVPGIGLGADVMVGFPGETDDDFAATCDLIEASPLRYLHVFQYSERTQVAAARLPDKVTPQVMHARSKTLRALGRKKHSAFQQQWLGSTLEVLFESRRDNLWIGHTGNYLEVAAPSDALLENVLARVRVESLEGGRLRGVVTRCVGSED